jgi:DTW domain-containing protein YfiP
VKNREASAAAPRKISNILKTFSFFLLRQNMANQMLQQKMKEKSKQVIVIDFPKRVTQNRKKIAAETPINPALFEIFISSGLSAGKIFVSSLGFAKIRDKDQWEKPKNAFY